MDLISDAPIRVETHAIDYIPAEERHGRPNTLLTFWAAGNISLVALVTGAVPISLGLDLKWAIISIIVGNLIGGLFMAYHSVQGPRLGMPQMIQSRAQFGLFGNVLPLIVVTLMYIGFFVLGIVVGGQAVAALTGLSSGLSMVISAAIMLVMAWVGYDLFHAVNRVAAVLSGVLFLVFTIKFLTSIPSHMPSSSVTFGSVLLSIAIFASWQITWAPYVSDYSRYLPENTPAARTFWYTYIGSAVGACWAMSVGALGAIVGAAAFSSNTAGYLGGLFPAVTWLVLIVLVVGVYSANYENLYGSFLTLLTALSPSGTFAPGPILRVITTTIVAVICTLIAVVASTNFLTNLTNFLALTLAALIPWTAINLTDYYLVQHGKYTIGEFFKRDGVYGLVKWPAVAIFLVTIAVEIPFLDTPIYEGPIAKSLGGGDISWIVGLILASGVYYLVAKRAVPAKPLPGKVSPDIVGASTRS
jgi:nucleobase:cation symporter-1, NCS1 family